MKTYTIKTGNNTGDQMSNTQNLADFGQREREIAAKLMTTLNTERDKTVHFQKLGVVVEFNPYSGYVFLVDEDYNVAILNDNDELEDFITCPNCGGEGVSSEFREENKDSECCQEYADDMEVA